MPRSQFVSNRLLLLVLLLFVIPGYGVVTGQRSDPMLYSLVLGAVLWVWKWRWWWEPIRDFADRRTREGPER